MTVSLKPIRRGMTLVELLVAVVLSAMLLAALTGVLDGVVKQSKIADAFDHPVWPAEFLSLLRSDLLAADAIWAERGTVYIRTDPPHYRADQPHYRVGPSDDREEESSDTGMRKVGYHCKREKEIGFVLIRIDENQPSVLAMGPTKIVLERLDDTGTPQPLPPTPGPVPEQVRVWVWATPADAPVILRDLVLR